MKIDVSVFELRDSSFVPKKKKRTSDSLSSLSGHSSGADVGRLEVCEEAKSASRLEIEA
jgi:hypothetical protein